MHICFVVEGYPVPKNPTMTFVRELVAQLAKKGVQCSVIAPQSLTNMIRHRMPLRKRYWVDELESGERIDVYQPYCLSASNRFIKFAQNQFIKAAQRAFKRIKDPVDALYGHFWHMGVAASKVEPTLPVFVASGESKISVLNCYSKEEVEVLLARLKGVIYVGTKVYNESVELGLQRETPYIIAPNGYDPSVFRAMSKAECRKALGWSDEAFIVSFVGTFDTRKGVDRLTKALNTVNETRKVHSAFIGKEGTVPACKNSIFIGPVQHSALAKYLNATDVFVLPTNNEGCCNAIVEAVACGLPVISSNQSFNDDIIDETCSIKIDPMNVEELTEAIAKLRDDNALCKRLGEGALEKAKELRLDKRAEYILEFIKTQLSN